MSTTSLRGKLVSQIEIKSSADVFHELFRHKTHQLSKTSPHSIHNCDLHDGDWGTVGSIISFDYTHDGKKCVSKDRVEAIDEEKKLVKFKVIEGDPLELYKNISITVHVDTHGESNLVAWTIEYEKLHEGIPDPNTLMDLCLQLTKDVESHHLSSPYVDTVDQSNLVTWTLEYEKTDERVPDPQYLHGTLASDY
ncbi:OLC1v1032064C1 [Oldenlandia corymbosa var. corymbosa]|uniref:OLC1v1032064C1 n=1 Tax=Oldenlandia corymbosa var. corymbosa TaxID=529605 RepID=A0AAV1CJU1_OLDCO|nr:OLC1v1032064C1 [Oldenlandia corymbosa var. corymbosa]